MTMSGTRSRASTTETEAEQLVDARRRQLHQLRRAASPVATLGSARAERGSDFIRRRPRGPRGARRAPRAASSSRDVQVAAGRRESRRPVADRHAEHVAERMRRIGRQQQHTPAAVRRWASRSATAAATVVLPTPPLPPKNSSRALQDVDIRATRASRARRLRRAGGERQADLAECRLPGGHAAAVRPRDSRSPIRRSAVTPRGSIRSAGDDAAALAGEPGAA